MALDGISPSRDHRTLSNREAALLHGQWWECADDGAQVWQRLTIKPASETIVRHPSEAIAVNRAIRQLKRRRVELALQLDQLVARFESVSATPMARLLARRSLQELQAQIAAQRKLIADLPQMPVVHRLDPEASCGVLADATTKEIAAEVSAAETAEVAPVVVPRPASKPHARIEPIAEPLSPAELALHKKPQIAPVATVRTLHPDSIEALAAEPFDESMLG